MQELLQRLKRAGSGSRAVAVLVGLAIAATLGVAAFVAKRPSLEVLFADLGDADMGKVVRALSEAGVRFDVSNPPAPYTVFVEEGERALALHAVASGGALDHAPGGILGGESGMSTVFMSASEREQVVRKREWQEMERMLEDGFEFVSDAKVRTSLPERSPFGRPTTISGSVTLAVAGGRALSREEAASVAKVVRFGLGIEPENLVISDQSGKRVYDGSDLAEGGLGDGEDWLDNKQRYDEELTSSVNQLLADILGPGKARVYVNSEWDFDQTSSISESSEPDQRVVLYESSESTKTPQVGAPPIGGVAGTGSNVAQDGQFGVDNAAVAGPPTAAPDGASAADLVAKTDRSDKRYFAPRTTTTRVRMQPVLKRLNVSLMLDESLSERSAELAESVKSAVGYDEVRTDSFRVALYPFAAEDPAEEGAEEPEATDSAPSPIVELLLEKGVEIVSAIAFLFLLLRVLRGPGRKERERAAEERAALERKLVPDADALARARIEELLHSDPERVASILAEWALEEEPLVESRG